jgi:hypothetical protein
VIVWDTQTQQARQILAAHSGPVLYCSLSPDGCKVRGVGEGTEVLAVCASHGVAWLQWVGCGVGCDRCQRRTKCIIHYDAVLSLARQLTVSCLPH